MNEIAFFLTLFQSFDDFVWLFEKAFLLLHSQSGNGVMQKFFRSPVVARYRGSDSDKVSKNKFGGLKNIFYLCTPLRVEGNEEETKG
jgi:hypothetical protein